MTTTTLTEPERLDRARVLMQDSAQWARGIHRYFDAVELFGVPATESDHDVEGLRLALGAAREARAMAEGLQVAAAGMIELLERAAQEAAEGLPSWAAPAV